MEFLSKSQSRAANTYCIQAKLFLVGSDASLLTGFRIDKPLTVQAKRFKFKGSVQLKHTNPSAPTLINKVIIDETISQLTQNIIDNNLSVSILILMILLAQILIPDSQI